MNRLTVSVGSLLLVLGAQQVAAGCVDGQVTGSTSLESLLGNQTVCGTGVGTNAGKSWQEWHQAGGTLTEYAKGPSDPVDPTHDVGDWSVAGDGTDTVVTYDYDGGGSYSLKVFDNGDASYSFCDGGTETVRVTLKAGQGACQ